MSRRREFTAMLVLATLVGVFVLANAVFVWVVERQAEETLENRLGSPTEVDLSGWPAGPRMVAGSLPEANVSVEEVRLPGTGMSLGQLDVNLSDVHYQGQREGLLDPPIEARDVRFDLRLSERQVSALAGKLPLVKGAELRGDGLRVLLAGGPEVDADLAADKGELVLRMDTPLFESELPLTPGGALDFEEVRVQRDDVIIEGRANGLGI